MYRKIVCLLLVALWITPPSSQAQDAVPIPVKFWHPYADLPRAQLMQSLADDFNAAHEGTITVIVEYFPAYPQQHEAILSALVNGGVPNVALVQNYDAALYQLSNSLVDLQTLAPAPDDFYPWAWVSDQWNGQQLGLPLTRSAQALYINANALQALGYDSAPQTREAWAEVACAYRESTGQPAFDLPLTAGFWQAVSHNTFFDPATGFDFTTPALVDSLAWGQDLLARGCAILTPQGQSAQNRFASGQTLFYVESSAARPYVEAAMGSYAAQPFSLLLAPIPSESGPVALWSGLSLSLFHTTPEQDSAAWEWMQWLTEAEPLSVWAEANAALPASMSITPAPAWEAFLESPVLVAPNLAGYDVIADEMSFALRGIVAGEDQNTSLQNLTQTTNRVWRAFAVE